MGLVCFVVVLGVSLRVSLSKGLLGFVRRGGSNDFGCLGGIEVDFVACE